MKTIGLARMGRDAEVRYTPGGDAVCNLSLAVNYGMKGEDGNRPTQWIDATLWGKQAEALATYLVKGSVHCFALSDVHLETFTRGDGTQGTKLAARVDSVELGPRQGGSDQQAAPARQAPPAGAPRPAPKPAPNFSDMDDDIPF
jgi:single-strand DNA-binding protein